MYGEEAAAAGGPDMGAEMGGGPDVGGESVDGDAVDAEFEEVKDDENK